MTLKIKPSEFHSNKKAYNWLIYELNDKFLEKYSKYYKGILVDLGCGEAPYKKFFLQYCKKYIGVDWTNSLHNIKADVVSDLNKKINLPDEFADTIISLSVMEHLYEPQIFLSESYRILKGGYIILQVPFQWWVHEEPYDYFRYTPYGLKYLFEKSGFKVIKIEPIGGFFTMLLLKLNYVLLRLYKGKFFPIIQIIYFIWNINQIIDPLLEKLDKHPDRNTSGYFVVAMKEDNVIKK